MMNNIDNNLKNIYFYKLYINAKIMQNLHNKPILKITTNLNSIYIVFWSFF